MLQRVKEQGIRDEERRLRKKEKRGELRKSRRDIYPGLKVGGRERTASGWRGDMAHRTIAVYKGKTLCYGEAFTFDWAC